MPMTGDEKKRHGLAGRKRPAEVCKKISESHKGKPKNYPSWLKGRTGLDHPAYKHGQGGNREYNHEKHAAWIQGVKRAYDFKCFITGRNHNLECHHLIGFAQEETRYLIRNGIPLCKEIHRDFHNQYGRGYSIPEQFEKFCLENYNITYFPWRHGNHNPSNDLLTEQELIAKQRYTKDFDFVQLVSNREHEILEGFYKNNSSLLTLFCVKHNLKSEVKAGNYKRAVFGLYCCAKEKQGAVVAVANKNRKRKSAP